MGFLFGSPNPRASFHRGFDHHGTVPAATPYAPHYPHYPVYPQPYQDNQYVLPTQHLYYPEPYPYQYDHANYGYQHPYWGYHQYNPYQQYPMPYRPFVYEEEQDHKNQADANTTQ